MCDAEVSWYLGFGKRLFDLSISTVACLVLAPVFIALWAGARAASPGPAIFAQQRVGRNGVPFTLYKFRSLPIDVGDVASDRLGEVAIKPYGRFVRRTNLDELPQLFNILLGDMSLVGPRPPIPSQRELIRLRYENGAMRSRPGLTGLAQIRSFDGMSEVEKAHFDGEYAERITLGRDLAIIAMTFGYLCSPPPRY